MPRRPRVYFPGALYEVISRGNQRQKIYKDDVDYRRFETLLGEVIQRPSLVLHAYVLLLNHFHLLLEVCRAPLSKAMQPLLYRDTRRYTQRYRKMGHLNLPLVARVAKDRCLTLRVARVLGAIVLLGALGCIVQIL